MADEVMRGSCERAVATHKLNSKYLPNLELPWVAVQPYHWPHRELTDRMKEFYRGRTFVESAVAWICRGLYWDDRADDYLMYYHRHEDTVSRSDDDRCECSFYTTTPTNEGWDKWDVQFTEDPKRRRRR